VTAVMRSPVSWINSVVDWFQVPVVSTATVIIIVINAFCFEHSGIGADEDGM